MYGQQDFGQQQPFQPGISGPLGPFEPRYLDPYSAALGLQPGNQEITAVLGPIALDRQRSEQAAFQRRMLRQANYQTAPISAQEMSLGEALLVVACVAFFPVSIPYFIGRRIVRRLSRR